MNSSPRSSKYGNETPFRTVITLLRQNEHRTLFPDGISAEDSSILYGLFMQATRGDNTDTTPTSSDVISLDKFRAWSGFKGLSKADAQEAYILKLRELLQTVPLSAMTEESANYRAALLSIIPSSHPSAYSEFSLGGVPSTPKPLKKKSIKTPGTSARRSRRTSITSTPTSIGLDINRDESKRGSLHNAVKHSELEAILADTEQQTLDLIRSVTNTPVALHSTKKNSHCQRHSAALLASTPTAAASPASASLSKLYSSLPSTSTITGQISVADSSESDETEMNNTFSVQRTIPFDDDLEHIGVKTQVEISPIQTSILTQTSFPSTQSSISSSSGVSSCFSSPNPKSHLVSPVPLPMPSPSNMPILSVSPPHQYSFRSPVSASFSSEHSETTDLYSSPETSSSKSVVISDTNDTIYSIPQVVQRVASLLERFDGMEEVKTILVKKVELLTSHVTQLNERLEQLEQFRHTMDISTTSFSRLSPGPVSKVSRLLVFVRRVLSVLVRAAFLALLGILLVRIVKKRSHFLAKSIQLWMGLRSAKGVVLAAESR